MRKLMAAALLAFIAAAAGSAQAQPPGGFGVGVIIGEPTGLSFKKWIGNDRAVDGGIAWSFSGNDSLQLHADYLIHWFDVLPTVKVPGRLPLYLGLGGRIKLQEDDGGNDHDTLLGVRIPFGISYLFVKVPVDLFVEIVPVVDLVPDTDFDLNGALGARYYF